MEDKDFLQEAIKKAHEERKKRNKEIVDNCKEKCTDGKKQNGEQCTCMLLEH